VYETQVVVEVGVITQALVVMLTAVVADRV
jgi:hypothetical protein